MITRPSSLFSSVTDRHDRQTITVIDQKTSEDSAGYPLGRNLAMIRLRSSINTDASAVANHSSGLLSSMVVDNVAAMVRSFGIHIYWC
jgi:hypothetical protein